MEDDIAGEATARTLERIEELFELGDPPHATRPGLSEAEDEAHRRVSRWMQEAGLDLQVDRVGNLFAHRPGGSPDLPEIWIGSHLDTVPQGGRFDGALGVLAALEAVSRLRDADLDRGIAVVAFRDEEGARFGRSCFGSRALCGQLEPGELDAADPDGVTVAEALARAGRPPEPVAPEGWLEQHRPRCFLELHVEQGPVLAAAGATIGVVTSITGVLEYEVEYAGKRGHAGTTPMEGRADALVAAAELVQGLSEDVRGVPGAVATVGRMDVRPGAPNVIPDRVTLSIDCRAPEPQALRDLDELVRARVAAIAAHRGVRAEVEQAWDLPPAAMDPALRETLALAARDEGVAAPALPSGAGHDAAVLARAGVPAAMLFARSLHDGISHAPEEHTDADAIGDAIRVLSNTLARLARDGG